MTIFEGISPRSVIPALAWMALIFGLSSIPGVVHPDDDQIYSLFVWLPPDLQNLLHVPVFGMLAWLWQRAFRQSAARPALMDALAVVLTVAYGVLDEWHQAFVPGRYASFTDVLLDGTGALLGVLAGRWLLTRWTGRYAGQR